MPSGRSGEFLARMYIGVRAIPQRGKQEDGGHTFPSGMGTGISSAPPSPLQAQAICIHPLYVMLPCTLSASLAFMLPVATPPNAIAFSFGGLRVTDMARAGFMLNIIGVLVITLAINTWSIPMFDLHTFPSWAYSNATASCGVSQANTTTPRP